MSRDVVYQRENMKTIFSEGFHLLEKHFHEIAHYQDIDLAPDQDAYYHAERMGNVEVFTAREGSALIGYAIFFIRQNMHYKKSKQAVQDVVFIQKDKRGLGLNFIKWCDLQLKERGVQVVMHHVKTAHDWGPALEKIGYEFVDKIYARRLDF